MLSRATVVVALALSVAVTACGDDESDNANPKPAAGAAYGGALLAQIPTLGETYDAQLARFVDTEEGKPFGLAVTVADDGTAVAYLCNGKTLGRAFVGTIEDAAGSATLKAVKGAGTVDLKLSGDAPSAATVTVGDVTDEFTLAPTKVGGYFREKVDGVTRGWVVSDTLAIKGVATDESGGKGKATTSGQSLPPLSPADQQLAGAEEDAQAPPDTAGFLKELRCRRLKAGYETAFEAYENDASFATANPLNLATAKGKQVGCDFAAGLGFFPTR